MSENNVGYYLIRAEEEDRCAAAAIVERAHAIHFELAAAYRTRAIEELGERTARSALSAVLPITFWSPVLGPATQAAMKVVFIKASNGRESSDVGNQRRSVA